MSVEVSIVCDVCGTITASDKTAARARSAIKDMGGAVALPDGMDVCAECRLHDGWRGELDRWRVDRNA